MIYFIQASVSKHVKIGFTAGEPTSRLTSLQTGNHEELQLIAVIPGDRSIERALHDKFKDYRRSGEWFAFEERLEAYCEGLLTGLTASNVKAHNTEFESPTWTISNEIRRIGTQKGELFSEEFFTRMASGIDCRKLELVLGMTNVLLNCAKTNRYHPLKTYPAAASPADIAQGIEVLRLIERALDLMFAEDDREHVSEDHLNIYEDLHTFLEET